jgi:hypothetical protein
MCHQGVLWGVHISTVERHDDGCGFLFVVARGEVDVKYSLAVVGRYRDSLDLVGFVMPLAAPRGAVVGTLMLRLMLIMAVGRTVGEYALAKFQVLEVELTRLRYMEGAPLLPAAYWSTKT